MTIDDAGALDGLEAEVEEELSETRASEFAQLETDGEPELYDRFDAEREDVGLRSILDSARGLDVLRGAASSQHTTEEGDPDG